MTVGDAINNIFQWLIVDWHWLAVVIIFLVLFR